MVVPCQSGDCVEGVAWIERVDATSVDDREANCLGGLRARWTSAFMVAAGRWRVNVYV